MRQVIAGLGISVVGLSAALLAQKPPAPTVAPTTMVPEMVCPAPLGPGVETGRAFCDVMSGSDPAAGIAITLPPHRGPVTLRFDLHNRHTYSEELVRTSRAYTRYTAVMGVLAMDNTLISRAAVQSEFRGPSDLVDRIGGGAGPGGVKAVAPTGTESITIVIPERENAVSLLGEKLTIERADGSATYTAPGRPIAVISNVAIEFRPGPAPRAPTAAELKRLEAARIRTVILPGTHDCYDRSSIYRSYDLAAMAGSGPDDDSVTVLTPDRPSVFLEACDLVVYGTVFPTKRAPVSPLRDLRVPADEERLGWHVGMVHGSIAIPDRTDRDEVVVTKEEIAATGLDYLALGHWHSVQRGKAGTTTYAYSGAPEPVAVNQDGAGNVLLVTLEEKGPARTITVEERRVGLTRFEKLELDAARIRTQPDLIGTLLKKGDPNLVLEVTLTGVRPDELDLDTTEVEEQLNGSFLRARVRDASIPALSAGSIPSPDTIAGAFIRDVEARIAELEADPAGTSSGEAAELRDVLRLGRLLLAGHEVTL